MENFKNILVDYVDSLYETDDPHLMFSALENAIKALGFDYVSYAFIPSVILSAKTDYVPVFQLSNDYEQRFIQHYSEAGFTDYDYTVKSILNRDMSVKNWWDDAKNKILTKKEENVINVARYDYGIENGVTIPTYGDGKSAAAVSISSKDKSIIFNFLYEERIDIIKKMSFMYSDRVLGISKARSLFESPFINTLSITEKKILSKLSEGYNVQSIASDLKIDYKYVANKVLPSIRKKMGGVSRDKMMYFAGCMVIDKALE